MELLSTWGPLAIVVVLMLALDLGVFNRKAHRIEIKEAALTSLFYVAVGCGVGAWVWLAQGAQLGMEYFTAFILEKALSVDNLFVFMFIFDDMKVNPIHRHRVLFWGVLGAIVMRLGILIAGAAIVMKYKWLLYILGGVLIYSGIKGLFAGQEKAPNIKDNRLVKLVRWVWPVTDGYRDNHFLVHENGNWMATPLLIVLVAVEAFDLVFAMDSLPVVMSVTRDPFVLVSSNVCAVLGLRALYFLFESIGKEVTYLKHGVSVVLIFIGGKMLADIWHVHVSTQMSLSIVFGVLLLSTLISLPSMYRSWQKDKTEGGDETSKADETDVPPPES